MRSLGLLRLVIGFLAVLFALSINAFGQSGPCTLTVTPASGFSPLNVSATASCDPQSGFFLQAIDWRDGNQDPFPPGQTSGSLTHTYATPSSYFVGLSAANATGTQTFANQNVTVDTPVACKLAMNPSRGAAPLKSTATGICSSVNATVTSVTVDFGDGSPQSSVNGSSITASNTYTQLGQFTTTITGKDANGQTGSRFQLVNVTATPPTLPTAPVNGDLYVRS